MFSTVGTVLGGPVGSAIGALIGQSIDQQLLGGSSRGPRLGDLSVQTSSYGTQVPRIYGTMRVAGSVVWSTDLVESSETSGAKGQPDTVFSYSVSFAVALSSRPVSSIGRIWADGKLIRDEDGSFKVATGFRLHAGGEDQEIDALIASAEGIASTPAYRGLTLAVFENLELAEFGNRIPFLTFEVVADEAPPELDAILADATSGIVQCDPSQELIGFAAYGRSMRSAVEPLIDCFAVELFDDGFRLRSPDSTIPAIITEADFGCSADGERVPKLQREQEPALSLPASLRLSYYDPSRDFQSGETRASAGEQDGNEEQRDLPAVLDTSAAKSLCQQILARRWAERDKLTLRLPPSYLGLRPASRIELPLTPASWTVNRCTLEGFVLVADLRPSWNPAVALIGDAGRVADNVQPGIADVTLALLDVPQIVDPLSDQPSLLLAASSPTPGWKSVGVEVTAGSQTVLTRTAARKAVLGQALSVLGPGEPYLIDKLATVDVELLDQDQWLISCDDEALVSGTNLAVLGGELIQFGEAVAIGPGQFRLRRLLRGRRGTEWTSGAHSAGEPFVLLEQASVRGIPLPDWAVGSQVTAAPSGAGGGSQPVTVQATGESLRPLPPVRLDAMPGGSGDFLLSWVRRSRRGWAWIDGIDAPLGENREEYRVTIGGPLGSFERTSSQPELTVTATELASVGSGAATVEVRQIGDWGASRPAHVEILIP
ncbi:MAG TPA: phage tail protein [Sphingomicrobium sp.]